MNVSEENTFPMDRVMKMVDEVARRSLAHAIGLFVYFKSYSEDAYKNTISTLREGFGEKVANEVYDEIPPFLKGLNRYTQIVVENTKRYLGDYIADYVYHKYVAPLVYDEVRKRLANSLEEDKRYLVIMSGIILLRTMNEEIGYPIHISDKLCISYSDEEYLDKAVASVVNKEVIGIRRLFLKYLLGYLNDSSSRRHNYYRLCIYQDTYKVIEELGREVKKYINVLDDSQIQYSIERLIKENAYTKISVLDMLIDTYPGSDLFREEIYYLSSLFGLPHDILCRETNIEGILWNCNINPFIYAKTRKMMKELWKKSLKDFMEELLKDMIKGGFKASCDDEKCIFTKEASRPILFVMFPWPRRPRLWLYQIPRGTSIVFISRGAPLSSIVEWLNRLISSDYLGLFKGILWLYKQDNKIYVASNTYDHNLHSEILRILSATNKIVFLGQPPEEALKIVQQFATAESAFATRTIQEVEIRYVEKGSSFTGLKPTKEILESIVAKALEDIGFRVLSNVQLPAKGGAIEVDVWGVKDVDGMQFRVYVSCKNWDKEVDRQIIDHEYGRVQQLINMPHLRIIVAKRLSESARKAALDDGFLVIELGEKASTNNAQEIYEVVSRKLRNVFIGIAPQKLRDLAERLKNLAKEIEEII